MDAEHNQPGGGRPPAAAAFEIDARTLLDLSGVLFVGLDTNGRVALANRMACAVLACREEEALGADWFETFLPPDQRELVRATFARLMKGELQPVEYYDNPVLTRRGEQRLISWHNALLRDADGRIVGTLSSGLDVTEHRRAMAALQESEERFRTLFHGTRDGMLVADAASRRFVTANQAMCDMLGVSVDELRDLAVDDIHPPEDLPRVLEAFERQRRGELDVARAMPVRRRDGSVLRADISSSAVALGGRACVLGVFRDITARLEAEEAHRQLQAKVLEAQKLESLGMMAGGVAHDFNNLLVGILGHADLALAELPGGSPAADSVTGIITAARRAAELCRQMLAYSGRGRLVVSDFDLGELVREMAHLLQVTTSGRVAISHDLAPGLPSIRGDESQIRQVVLNLVTNAAEAAGASGGKIRVRTRAARCDRATLAATYLDDGLPEGDYVLLEVEDSGCGMDADTQRRVFEPFFTTKQTGRGLGLAVVLGIVRGHRGAIRITSAPGGGATFAVLLPATADVARPSVEPQPADSAWRGSGRVLLADDEETVRLVVSQMLRRLGFSVAQAVDGVEAVELLRLDPAGVRCVVLDLTMPRMDGETALRELRAIRPDLPVVVASGFSEPEALAAVAAGGPTAFIQKPYRTDELAAALETLLG